MKSIIELVENIILVSMDVGVVSIYHALDVMNELRKEEPPQLCTPLPPSIYRYLRPFFYLFYLFIIYV